MNESPFESRYGLWMRETGQRAHEEDEKNERMQLGLELEPWILQTWAERTGKTVQHNRASFHCRPKISATPDGLVDCGVNAPETADAKTVQPWERRDWLEGVPRYYWWQVQQQTLCLNSPAGWIVALFGVQELAATRIEADKQAHARIEAEAATFWRQVNGELPPPPPDDHRSTVAALMAMQRVNLTINLAQPEIADAMAALDEEYRRAEEQLRDAKKRSRAARAAILRALGNASCGTFPDGSGYRIDIMARKEFVSKATKYPKLVRFTSANTEDGDDDQE